MVIKKIPYKASGTRKYNVTHNGKEYTCYLNPYNGNSVVTGDGQSTAYRDISGTTLGTEIVLACYVYEQGWNYDQRDQRTN